MRLWQQVLQIVALVGLLLGPATERPAPPSSGHAECWALERHEFVALQRDVRGESPNTKPGEDDPPRVRGGAGTPPRSSEPSWGLESDPRKCRTRVLVEQRLPAALAQVHLGVNGAADAHGARG